MNNFFLKITDASNEDKLGLFLETSNQLGIPLQHIEKDFWVCWVIDILFNERDAKTPRLLFKGGTSLSKVHSIISRFSEDVDITIFREDLKLDKCREELEQLSRKQQRKYFEKITAASKEYISKELMPNLQKLFDDAFVQLNIPGKSPRIEIDPRDKSGQTLLAHYHSVNTETNPYVYPTVKIECGAKSALDPHQSSSIRPYIADVLGEPNFTIRNVTTVDAERTFWDKIIILHGIRRWYDIKSELRQSGHRYSRHYYDVCQILQSSIGESAKSQLDLAEDCVRHAQLFFNSPNLDLKSATPGNFCLTPNTEMNKFLKRDYHAMSDMIYGETPTFDEVNDTIIRFEKELNS